MATERKRKTAKARRGRGEGSIIYREDKGLWEARLSLGIDGTGKRIRKTVYGETKAGVAEKLRKLQADHDAGRLVETDDMTVGEYLTRWLVTAKDTTREGTYERYKQLSEDYLIPALGRIKLAKLRPIHVESAYAELTRTEKDGTKVTATAATRKAAGTVLGIALRHAVRLKLLPSNPAAEVKKPRTRFREMRFMTPQQAKQFLATAKRDWAYPLYTLAIGTGMRQGELLALTWADIDFDKSTVDVRRSLSQVRREIIIKEPKSRSSRRTVSLSPPCVRTLEAHRAAALKAGLITSPVFCTRNGTYLQRSNVLRNFRILVKRANKDAEARAAKGKKEPDLIPADIRFHDLRHTHASGLIAAGQSIKAVSRRLGHADVSMTLKVYAHLMPDDDAKLAEAAGVLFGVG
jgi:integrase